MKVSDINPAMNVPARVLIGESPAHVVESQRKRGRPIGAKDKQLRKRKPTIEAEIEAPIVSNRIISEESPIANYTNSKLITQQEVNDIFIFYVADAFVNESDPQTIQEAKASPFWDKWKEAIQAELNSLLKRGVFGKIQETPIGHTPVGYRWVFVRKRNDKGEVIRYKARFVAQGFKQ